MAFYTFKHLLHKDIYGKEVGELGILPEQLGEPEFDFVFLNKEYNGELKNKLQQLKSCFEYWYPVDLRTSGKDLIKNHLTMSLYNHLYVFGRE